MVMDGCVINLWVENIEYGMSKISDGIINMFIIKFVLGMQLVYMLVILLVGQLWGSYFSLVSLIDLNQVFDIVVLNIQFDSQFYGCVGYFWVCNNFIISLQLLLNQLLLLYVDLEIIYLGGIDGLNIVILIFGYEFIYMVNFYQCGVLYGLQYMYGMWLEEMMVMMMEDVFFSQIDFIFNNVCDSCFLVWL